MWCFMQLGDEVGAELTKKHGNTLKTVAVSANSHHVTDSMDCTDEGFF